LINIELSEGYEEFISSIDLIVMGRNSFQKVLSFGIEWPYKQPVIVLSQTMSQSDIPENLQSVVSLSNTDPLSLLHSIGEQRIYIDGGRVIQSFLRLGLVDEIIQSRVPVLIGNGLPLFGPLEKDILVRHLNTKVMANGIVQTKYEVMKK
jgi:dihydrofolate reductase